MNLFEKNLSLLQKHNPALARRASLACSADDIVLTIAKNGLPTLQYQSISLHSSYDPEQEAKKSMSGFICKNGVPTVVYGLGLGYHVAELLKSTSEKVLVVEPSMSIFRAFLSTMDLDPFLPVTDFLVAEPAPKILVHYPVEGWNKFVHKPSARIFRLYFDELERGADLTKYLASHRLKILVVNPIYGGSLPTARFCATALENLGHEVESVQCERFADSFFASRKVTRNKQNAEVLSNLFMNLINEVIVAKAVDFQPDLILALAQAPLTKENIVRLKSLHIPIAFWFVEDFRTLTYWKDVASVYDYFFTIQKGEFFDELKVAKSSNYYYLPQACLPSLHKPVELTGGEKKQYGAELSFMGAAYYNRIQSFPKLLDFDFKIWGSEWNPNSVVGPCLQNNGERVSSEECVKIYNAAKINLNLHSSSFHESVNPHGDFVNPRTFEVAACRAFQLVDAREDLHDMFRVGEEIIDYKSMEELKDKILYYLEHEDERMQVAVRGYARVLRSHTMEHRMRELLARIFLDHFETLKKRIDERKPKIISLIEEANPDSELGQYLIQFKNVKDFSLKVIVDQIAKGEGALTKNELLLLMVDQVVQEGV